MKFQELKQQSRHLLMPESNNNDEFDDLEATTNPRHDKRGSARISRWKTSIVLWTQALLIAVLTLLSLHLWQEIRSLDQSSRTVYSPAQSAIRHVNMVSTSGFGHDVSPYSGKPSDANNALWKDLYDFGLSRIPIESAAQLVNRTVPIPGDPGHYIVSLDVFHELHCLNKIRQRLWLDGAPDPDDMTMRMDHIDHCIDMLRQNLMCSSDITPLPFIWDKTKQTNRVVGKVQRTCRDFDAVKRWALDHQVHGWDPLIRVEDPLGNMEY